MRLHHFVLAAPACVLVAALTVSQDQPTPSTRSQTPSATPSATKGMDDADRILANWILIDNNNEIALSELAVQRALDPEVKSFAQKMVDEHRALAQKLQSFAVGTGLTPGKSPSTPPGQMDKDKDKDKANKDKDKDKDKDPNEKPVYMALSGGAQASPKGLDHIALLQDLGNQCLSSAKKELEQKQGADFDRCFMGMALGAHMKANDMLTVFQRYATSSELKDTFRSGQQTVATHLQQAKDLVKKLEKGMQ